MNSALLIILLVAAVAAAIFFAVRRRRPAGFREWIRDPQRFYDMVARQQLDEAVMPPANPTSTQILEQVEGLLQSQKARTASAWLKKVGRPAVPHLVRALQDPRFASPPKGQALFRTPALDNVTSILGDIGAAEAVPVIAALLESPDAEIRKCAALCLGWIAQPSCAPALSAALHDGDEYVRNYALIGLRRAIDAGRPVDHLSEALFLPLLEMLTLKSTQFDGKHVQFLLRFDRERAVREISARGILSATNSEIVNVLRGLNSAGVALAERDLSRLEQEFQALESGYVRDYGIGETIVAMVAARMPGTEAKARAALDSETKPIRDRAADALALMRGVREPMKVTCDRLNEHGWEKLTEPQRNYYCVSLLDAEVNNGGFSQYFFNSYSDRWPQTLTALKELNLTRVHELLKSALDLFGPSGPSQHRAERESQLAALVDKIEPRLSELDERYYKSSSDVYSTLMLYAAENPDDFRK